MNEREVRVEMMFDGDSQHGSYWRHLLYRWKWWLLLRALVCFAAVFLGSMLLVGGERNVMGAFLVTIGALGFVRPLVWGMWHERGLRKHPAYGGALTYVFSADGVVMDGKAGRVDLDWPSIYELKVVSRGLLIYLDKKQYMWVPAKAFGDGEMKQVVAMWEASK